MVQEEPTLIVTCVVVFFLDSFQFDVVLVFIEAIGLLLGTTAVV